MALKRSNKREKQEANDRSPTWPDLPEQLINFISSEPILLATVRGSGVTKLWRFRNINCRCLSSSSTGSRPLQWLEVKDHPVESKPIPMDSSTYFHPKIKKVHYYARSWLVYSLNTRGDTSSSVDQVRGHRWRGNWNKKTYSLEWKCTPGAEDLLPFYIYNMPWPNGIPYRWKRLDSETIDPNCNDPSEPSHLFRIANGIGIRDRFYVISLQGTLAVVEEAGLDWELKITRIGRKRAVPSVESKYFREFMVESDGEVLVVFLVSRQSVEVVDDVEVYKVDEDDLKLVKKKGINGGRSLFLGTNCVVSVLASQVGCRRNCVYFTVGHDHGWSMYDMDLNSISDVSI